MRRHVNPLTHETFYVSSDFFFCIYKQSIGFPESLFEVTMESGPQPFFTFNSFLPDGHHRA